MEKNKTNFPRHIALVVDGNRRYAKKLGLNVWKGHEFGAKKIEELLEWCKDLGIEELTLYVFSSENFNRAEKEIRYVMNLFRDRIKKIRGDKRLTDSGLRIDFIGRLNLFPKDIQDLMQDLMEKTKENKKFKVNLAMGYGGRQEIVDAAKKIVNKVKKKELGIKDINEKVFEENLYLHSYPDILIRPGGEKRISNFLLWQNSYSELFFVDKLWPEFTKEDLIGCIEEFKTRERRFGV